MGIEQSCHNPLPTTLSTSSAAPFPGMAPRLLPRGNAMWLCRWSAIYFMTFWQNSQMNSVYSSITLTSYVFGANPTMYTCTSSSMIFAYVKDINITVSLTGTHQRWFLIFKVIRLPAVMWRLIGKHPARRIIGQPRESWCFYIYIFLVYVSNHDFNRLCSHTCHQHALGSSAL